MYKISEKKTWANIIFLRPSEIAFIKFICKSTSSILFIRSKQSPFIRLSFAISLSQKISKATNPQCLGLSRSYKNTHTRPNFPYSWDDRANVYYNSKKIYILFKINIFPKFYAETLNTSREVFVINLGFNFQFKVMITIVAN